MTGTLTLTIPAAALGDVVDALKLHRAKIVRAAAVAQREIDTVRAYDGHAQTAWIAGDATRAAGELEAAYVAYVAIETAILLAVDGHAVAAQRAWFDDAVRLEVREIDDRNAQPAHEET